MGPSSLLAAVVAISVASAFDSEEGRREALAARRREQNRLVGDLAIHTVTSLQCARVLRPGGGGGQRCWAWGLGMEGGVALDQEDEPRGGRYARSVFLGPSPLTFGSWYFRDEHRFTDLEAAFVEPFAFLKVGAIYERSPSGERELGKLASLTVGTRAWVAWTVFRAGLELAYELGPPELARGLFFGAFVGLALHYAPTRR